MADVVIIGEIGDNDALQFKRVNRGLPLVSNGSVLPNKHRVGYGGVPLWIESSKQRINVAGPQEIIPACGVEIVQNR